MRKIYVCTMFERVKGCERPSVCGIVIGDQIIIKELFRSGEGKKLDAIKKTIDEIRKIIISAVNKGIAIITSDFKTQIEAFDLPLNLQYKVYDTHLPTLIVGGSKHSDITTLNCILQKMQTIKVKEYQRLIADAAIVYEDLQRAGLMIGYEKVNPIYMQHTYSGRSKTVGFNIQGFADDLPVWSPRFPDHDILIHFDWVCADIRIASLLSGDQKLMTSFDTSDPYTAMMEEINAGSDDKITREESKLFLLKSINSMDFNSDALCKVYPVLGNWIMKCKSELREENSSLQTILGRRFKLAHAKNELAVLNGVMQGSVAHAMQHTVRRIWERIGPKLITEIHDSLVMVSTKNNVQDSINEVVGIMARPFDGILDSNPLFPIKVSVGKKWKKWKLFKVYRDM